MRLRLEASSFERLQAAVKLCKEKGQAYAMEVEHLRRDGSSFPAYLRGEPVYDSQGALIGISGTLQDISERKEQSDRLEALADNLPSGVIFRVQRNEQRQLVLQFLSAGLEAQTGYAAKALLRNPAVLLQAMGDSCARRMVHTLVSAEQPGELLDASFALRTLSGERLWIHCRAALRYPGTGGAVWDGIARDVTLERAAQDALRASKDAAEAAERAKSDFLATMSHEIRTPMNSVIGMARLAMRTNLDAKQRHYLEKINESANVLLGIINDILDFSKIEAGGLALEKTAFKLESVLDTVASVTSLRAEEKRLEITFSMAPDVPDRVRGDVLRLGQVLTNLVSNAIKFTERGDVLVRVEVRDQDSSSPCLHFAVTDTGIGLSEAQIQALFQPFSQAQADTARRYGGTGLGLAISKRLVEMMGGSIGVSSAPGSGSTFYFTVPLELVQDTLATSHTGFAAVSNLRGRRILIADDNALARNALAEMAQGFGMYTTLATNGHEAVQLLREHLARDQMFDMVVLDWQMPVMDGLQAARAIKQDTTLERMPAVLMVTAYGQDAMLQASQGLELQGVLIKPVTQSAMFNTLLLASSGQTVDAPLPGSAAYVPSDLQAFATLRGKRVLVADDNALNREVASDFLSCVGVEVLTAVDGQDAIRCLQTQQVDAVLMDIHMPHMDGLQATREIRRHLRWMHLPIIALTAQARSEDVQLSRAAGMNGHLTKPIDEVALYTTLMQHCVGAAVDRSVPDGAQPEGLVDQSPEAQTQPFRRMSGSPARRAQLLRGFLQDFEPLPVRVQELAVQERWLEVAALAHQIKGSASYLDRSELCTVADTVESAARAGHAAEVREHLPSFVQHVKDCLDDVRHAIEHLQAQQHPAQPKAHAVDAEATLRLLEQVRPLVASGNFAAHALLQQLVQAGENQPWSHKAEAALDAFDDLENEQCLLLLEEIKHSLGAG